MPRPTLPLLAALAALPTLAPFALAAPSTPADRWAPAPAPRLDDLGLPGDKARLVESFDRGWRFARFGKIPGGDFVREPGGDAWTITATASSEEGHNPAGNALDASPGSRWCAANASADQWLAFDFGKPVALGSASVAWEEKSGYAGVLEGSADGRNWTKLADAPGESGKVVKLSGTHRHVRVRTTGLPRGRWASVREVAFTDAAGKPLRRERLATAERSPDAAAFDDQSWRALDLPHDWAVEGPFTFDVPGETGRLPWIGTGWYRKTFTAPAALAGKRVFLEFDGAMSHAQVWINGEKVGERPYGYASFQVELTKHLKPGAANVVAVRLDNPPESSRWYPGAGIYRHVRLVATGDVRLAPGGVFVSTPSVSAASAQVKVVAELENPGDRAVEAVIETRIYALGVGAAAAPRALGAPVVSKIQLPAGATRSAATQQLALTSPAPWSPDSPFLYAARTTVSVAGKPVDTLDTTFGVRTVAFDAKKGFLLNGKRLEIKGVCQHHDLGALGGAVNTRAMRRQLEILGAMGVNAIRTSHNPPAPEFLDLCDRMGFVVMNEAFDCWRHAKKTNDYSRHFDAWHERDLAEFVRRDRNHPSVVLWSTGNEIPESGNPNEGPKTAAALRDIIRREDPTRPVGIGCDQPAAGHNGMQNAVDVFGYNYKPHLYVEFMKRNPGKPVIGSETSSCVSSRGEYFFPVSDDKSKGFFNYHVSSYDLYAPGWAYRPDHEFAHLDKAGPAVAGEFVWTGFDYLGEPTPYNSDKSTLTNFHSEAEKQAHLERLAKMGDKSPSRSSYFGIVDLAGFPKDRYFLYQSRWRPELPVAHLLPHWTWPERAGQNVPVHAYTSGDEAELFLNGKSLGRKKRAASDYRLRWDDVKYAPGEIKLVAYRKGAKWAEAAQRTAGAPAKLALSADRADLRADGDDLAFLTVRVLDKAGTLAPRAADKVTFKVEGPAEIVATDNGDPTSFESFQSPERKAFNGLALAIVRPRRGEPGEIRVSASAEGLAPDAVTLRSR